MEIAELIDVLDREGHLMADAAAKAGTDARVPTCPGWQVRELLSHTGRVHRWATRYVTEGLLERMQLGDDPELDGAELVAWFREGHRALVKALADADPDLECFAFLPAPSPLAFWARRQAHETAIHRVDAESALGADHSPFDPAFAADGIDELLTRFHGLERSRVRIDTPRTLRLRATDTDDVWTVRLSAEPPHTTRGAEGDADCELTGPVGELYVVAWNRLPYSALSGKGDLSLAQVWREQSRV
ncbi:maleylpyruvate isomerase family mycothiol-dependent enzyme [Streptomyces sp. Rer75]|uniref:maleylpyruvate isomerase family mycothiol-dependent enzyme n=1 Tax=unclassified Streptomyces TaxID=2593676 RepID=UPI0015CFF1AA|nr:maleylpyruvate isomerase family mycothiol-dependent enzyme [Streptomyces sp. Rer75]QLH20330.1 maleylpyruvate isomerase family mycothiol-dependent enzyme [Streptomyces sp. Rer75]